MKPGAGPSANSLNENHQRRLRVACHYIDKLLTEIEGVLQASAAKTAFPRYAEDISAEQRRAIEDFVARMRMRVLRALDDRGIDRHDDPISALHAVRVALTTIGITLEELEPRYMRGYGEVPEAAAASLNEFIRETMAVVSGLEDRLSEPDKNNRRQSSAPNEADRRRDGIDDEPSR